MPLRWLALIMTGVLPIQALEIQPPFNWQRSQNMPPGIVLQFISQEPRFEFSANLNVSQKKLEGPADSLQTPAQLSAHMERIQARMFPMFKVVERQPRKVGNAQGMFLISRYAYGPMDLAALQLVFRHQGDLVNVVYTCLAKDLKQFRPEFEKSLATLKLDSSPSK